MQSIIIYYERYNIFMYISSTLTEYHHDAIVINIVITGHIVSLSGIIESSIM